MYVCMRVCVYKCVFFFQFNVFVCMRVFVCVCLCTRTLFVAVHYTISSVKAYKNYMSA